MIVHDSFENMSFSTSNYDKHSKGTMNTEGKVELRLIYSVAE